MGELKDQNIDDINFHPEEEDFSNGPEIHTIISNLNNLPFHHSSSNPPQSPINYTKSSREIKKPQQLIQSIEGVATPLWGKCGEETHTPKSGNWESSGTPATLKLNNRRQNTSPWCVFYVVGKVLKCRCPEWSCMSHLDICSPSYGQKKGRESNWQFDSWPLKVGNRPDFDVCRRSATWRWKALKESYKIASDLIPFGSLSKKLWMPKVPGVQPRTISRLLLGSPGKKCHLDVASARSCREYYMGEGGGFPRIRAVVSQVSQRSPVACPNTKRLQNEF